jgi:two-component system nitrogen regulation response regulator NtrX
MALVLIVDDVPALAEQYAYDLERVGGYDTMIAIGGREALDIIAETDIDCMILDLEMPEVDGFEVLRTIKKRKITIPVIVYTGTGDYDRCVKAIKLGAYSFIDKTESMERVAHEVDNTIEKRALEIEIELLKRDLGAETPLIGSSAAMRKLKEEIARIAPVPSTVLILGESGTGKELVARELHRMGPGMKKPFIALNCGALPDNLIESELFGHERGAFTGADRIHRGAFERAAGGPLFLDEIGDLPPAAQAKLLRVLENRQVTRVGGERSFNVEVRVVAATNRDLEADCEKKRFRGDLYFRLNVFTIQVPPLREHRSDIKELADVFLTALCDRFGIRHKRIAPETLDCLMQYEWSRNNIRELRNIIERMIISSDSDLIGLDHVPAEIRGRGDGGAEPRTFQERKLEAERGIIVAALERNEWHITRTAQDLGLADHASLLKIMRRHKLKRS